MNDPMLELQGAIVARLKASPEVSALISGRVYDRVPRDLLGNVTARFPYVSFGPSDEMQDDADCIPGFEFTLQIDCWSDEPGFPEVRRIAGAVRAALRDFTADLNSGALALFEWRRTDVQRAPAGVISHAAISFAGAIELPNND